MPTLETLPPEILFNILSFTDPFHITTTDGFDTLECVARQSKHLNSVVEEYTRGLLKQHANKTPKSTGPDTYRNEWIRWVLNTCQVCKKKSRRRAILDDTWTCCVKCDRQFPKMTMTDAITRHGLSKLDLFTPNILHPNLPPLSHGTYVSLNGTITMISEPDILARKKLIHGMLDEETATDKKALRRRCAAHDRITEAMDLVMRNGRWLKAYMFRTGIDVPKRKAFRTAEGREEYAREQLEKEWAAMGMDGFSADKPLELD